VADFCARCTVEMWDAPPDDNDFAGWLFGFPGWKWGLCEACGNHRFNNTGESQCGTNRMAPLGVACPLCEAWMVAMDDANAVRRESQWSVIAIGRELVAAVLDLVAMVVPGQDRRSRVHALATRLQPRGFEW
jgi:hypothetical protein